MLTVFVVGIMLSGCQSIDAKHLYTGVDAAAAQLHTDDLGTNAVTDHYGTNRFDGGPKLLLVQFGDGLPDELTSRLRAARYEAEGDYVWFSPDEPGVRVSVVPLSIGDSYPLGDGKRGTAERPGVIVTINQRFD